MREIDWIRQAKGLSTSIVKFAAQSMHPQGLALASGKPVHVRHWSGNRQLWVLPLERDETVMCEGCAENTPFYLSDGESDPVFVCSNECAEKVGYPRQP
jgi:hypothetical protein